jgi:hypothetical protein
MQPYTIHAFFMQKAGNRADEYEDAYAYTAQADENGDLWFAIADGATETSFSGEWARLLTSAYAEKRLTTITPDAIQPLSAEWEAKIAGQTAGAPLPWYAETKLIDGAASSLVGLHITASGGWKAIGAGDSCLFQVRGMQVVASFPLSQPDEFNSRPLLISTQKGYNTALAELQAEGEWLPGDMFYLMTDALAHWFLKRPTDYIPRLNSLGPRRFEKLIHYLRAEKLCKNDDVTFLRVRLNAPLGEAEGGNLAES